MMNAAIEKILGSVLLIAGLAIIGASLYLGINTFVKAQNPPEIFKPGVAEIAPSATPAVSAEMTIPKNLSEINPADLQKIISGNSISPEMLKAVIPPEMFNYIPKMLNLSVFSLFLWILITAGSRIASLGIALLKSNSDIKF